MIRKKLSTLLVPLLALPLAGIAQTSEPAGTAGKISREVWWNMSSRNDLEYLWGEEAFYQAADVASELDSLEAPQNAGNQFGQRLRGYIVAPVTGEYRFWASGDDQFALWLGTGESKFTKEKLIHYKGWTSHREWGENRQQASKPVLLQAGQRYYIEAQNKEGGGADHLSVAWSYASGPGLINWAREAGVVATQSSEGWGGSAAKAIDGNTSGRYSEGSITHTLNQAGSWWQADLGQDRLIDRVELFNRDQDGIVGKRLSNFRVSVLDSSGTVVASKDFHTAGTYVKANEYWEVGGVQGRVVKVELLGTGASGKQVLSLAEVQVFGRSNATDAYQSRQVVSGSVIESYAGSLSDQDDDELKDDWELAHGFDSSAYQGNQFSPFSDSDKDGMSNLEESLRNLNPFAGSSVDGFLTMERWTGIHKYDVEELILSDAFFGEPEVTKIVETTQFTNIGSYSGARLRGYITAPVSGNYRFWISSRNGGQLWLSDDSTKYKKKKIAEMGTVIGTGHGITSWDSNKWDQFSSQMSEEIYLEAGEKYFMEMLTQQGHGGGFHVSAAWAVPGQAREALPLTVISSYGPEAEDSDDDYLPDAWETQYGLSITDNGAIDRQREGENGDFDLDGLSNRAEYLAGTDPANPDTDGDSINDGDELRNYNTDPLQSDAPSGQLVASVNLSSYSSTDSSWSVASEGLVSDSFRGSVQWNLDIPSDGNWTVVIKTLLRGTLFNNESIPVKVWIDNRLVWNSGLVFGLNRESSLRVLTPYLTTGQHILKIEIDNVLARRSLAIQSVELLNPTGADSNNDGQPDWVHTKLSELSSIAAYHPSSRTSPAFLEGLARVPSDASVNGVSVTPLNGNAWYANVDLEVDQATHFTAIFEASVSAPGSITWQATNVLDNETLTIRKGDSLKLTAMKAANPAATYQLSFDPDDTTLTPIVGDLQGHLPTSSTNAVLAWTEESLDKLVGGVGVMQGSWIPATSAEIHQLSITGNTATFQLQTLHGSYTKVAKIQLTQTTNGITAHQIYARYKTGNHLGADFDTNSSSNAPAGSSGYGIQSLSLAFDPGITELTPASGLAGTESMTFTFDTPGNHKITALHADGSTGLLTVVVKQAEFDAEPQDLVNNSHGNIKLNSLVVDNDLHFDGGKSADVISTNEIGNTLYLRVAPKSNGSAKIAARLFKNGPILGTQTINLIVVADALQNNINANEASPDFENYTLITTPLVATNLPAGGKVKVTIFRAGVTFLDGSSVKWLNVDDFNNGVHQLQFLFPVGMAGGYCHYLDIYDRNGTYLDRR